MSQDIARTLQPDGYRIDALQLVVPSVFIGIFSLTLPVLTLQVYDRILPNPDSGTLPVLITGVCIAVAMEAGLRLCRAYTLGWSGAAYEHRLSCQAVRHILKADLSAVQREGTGENLNRMSAISKLREFHNGYDLVTYTELLFLIPYLGMVAYIAGVLVFVPLAVLLVFTGVSVMKGRRLNAALRERDRADDGRYDFLIEGLRGIHTIKAFSLEKPFLRRYERLQYDATLANYDVTGETAGTFNAATVFGHLMLACVITAGAWLVIEGRMTPGALIASIFLSGRIMQPVQRALGLWTRYQDYRVAQGKVREIFSMPVQAESAPVREPERKGNLALEDVGFRDVFHNVSLNLRLGQAVRISGDYGAGKSTLLKIIAGLYEPDEGSVRIDGVAPRDFAPGVLMNHVGLLTTEGTIFRGSIRDNLTRFNTIPEDNVRPVAAMLGIEDDVSRLPRGFDTWMDGVAQDTVPPGLRQLISIARVLATHPRILLFDNAEHNLDRQGYRRVHAMLGRLREKTAMILITDDNNISGLAGRHFMLGPDGLRETHIYGDSIVPLFRDMQA